MKILLWERLKKLPGLLATDRPEPVLQAERIVIMLRDVVLPAKVGVCVVVLYYLFYSGWLSNDEKSEMSFRSSSAASEIWRQRRRSCSSST